MDKRAEAAPEFLRDETRAAAAGGRGPAPVRRPSSRVPGLRREELAQLAGVSVDYYVRLEQGRTNNVSEEILEAVAQALRLDDDERAYLRNLAKPTRSRRRPRALSASGPGSGGCSRWPRTTPRTSSGGAPTSWHGTAWPPPCSPTSAPSNLARRNWGRMIFFNEDVQALFDDWTIKARETVAFLRLRAGEYPDDPELAALVGELSVKSEDFRRWWADHNVKDKSNGRKIMHHPLVGELVMDYESLRFPDDPDQVLVTYTVEANSPSETNLRLLASWNSEAPVH